MTKPKKDSVGTKAFIEFLNETIYPNCAEASISLFSLEDIVKDLRQDYTKLRRHEIFYNHIREHLDNNQQVVCKICNKTFAEIVLES